MLASAAPVEKSHEHRDLYGLVDQVVARRFRVLAVRHAGPRGLVYEVEPPGVGRARKALKVVARPEAREPSARGRLAQYVELLRGLRHPNLEAVHELGALPDDTPYLLTEWLPLDNLDDTLAHVGRLPVERALEIVSAVGEALDALHAKGVAHGDVRTHHVLLEPNRDGYERVVLIDAGVASCLGSPPHRGEDGPLAYLAPERHDGASATSSSDVYALGVLAYRLLTGHLPYRADDPRAAHVGADPVLRLQWLQRHAAAARPSTANPDIGDYIESVVGRALSPSADRRFVDARGFLDALERGACATDSMQVVVDTPVSREVLEPPEKIFDAGAPTPAPGAPAPAGVSIEARWIVAGVVSGATLGALSHFFF